MMVDITAAWSARNAATHSSIMAGGSSGSSPCEHLGLYAYTRECLLRLASLAPTPLERIEGLEQLRALEHGIPIRVVVETRCQAALVSVDTPADLERVRRILAARQQTAATVEP